MAFMLLNTIYRLCCCKSFDNQWTNKTRKQRGRERCLCIWPLTSWPTKATISCPVDHSQTNKQSNTSTNRLRTLHLRLPVRLASRRQCMIITVLLCMTASVSKFMLISVYIYLENMLKLGNLVPVGLSEVSTDRSIRQIYKQTQCFCPHH